MNTIRFLSYLILMLFIGASGFAFHVGFHYATGDGPSVGHTIVILIHIVLAFAATCCMFSEIKEEK